jgi:hypothetical protein
MPTGRTERFWTGARSLLRGNAQARRATTRPVPSVCATPWSLREWAFSCLKRVRTEWLAVVHLGHSLVDSRSAVEQNTDALR